jgi:L-iditol 2-dehydrogenase
VGRPQSWQAALALARPGGEVMLHGGCPAGSQVSLPTHPLHYSEIALRGSYHHTPRAFRAALGSLAGDDTPARELLGDPVDLDAVPRLLTSSPGEKHPVRTWT